MRLTTLQRYVLNETLRVAILSILALTGMIFVGMSVALVRHGLSVVQLRNLLPFLFAHSLPYALPSSILVATVFVFGRLSDHNELTAMRASGVNLNHVIWPLVAMAVLVSVGTFGLNHFLLPWSHSRVRNLTQSIIKQTIKHVGITHTKFQQGNYLIYVGGLTEDRLYWKNVAVIRFVHEYPAEILLAERGRCDVDEEAGVARFTLYDGRAFHPQLGDFGGEPMTFGKIHLAINLGGKESLLPNDIAPSDLKLIRTAVEKATAHAGRACDRMVRANYVIFSRGTEKDGSLKDPSFIEFSDEKLPAKILLAESAKQLPGKGGGGEQWLLSNGTAIPVRNSALAKYETVPFDALTLEIGLAPRSRVPGYGTDPAKLWFHTRPKYLVLPDLLKARRERKAKADKIRKMEEYARLRHPKSTRKLTERDEGKLSREYATLASDVPRLRHIADEIEFTIEGLTEQLKKIQAEQARQEQQISDLTATLERQTNYREQLGDDLSRLIKRNGDEQQLQELRKQIDELDRALEQLSVQLTDTRQKKTEADGKAAAKKGPITDNQKKLETAQAKLAEQRLTAQEALGRYNKLREHVENIRYLEKHLRTETQFHFRNAGSTTVLVFILIGIPLGILSRRGNVLMAFVVSFFAVLIIYYPLMIVGEMLARDGFMAPWMAMWMPNAAVGAIGLALLKWGIRR